MAKAVTDAAGIGRRATRPGVMASFVSSVVRRPWSVVSGRGSAGMLGSFVTFRVARSVASSTAAGSEPVGARVTGSACPHGLEARATSASSVARPSWP